jgi:hypothetical protein
LSFLNLVYEFYTSKCDGCVIEPLETKPWSYSLFYLAMILFTAGVESARRAPDEIGW